MCHQLIVTGAAFADGCPAAVEGCPAAVEGWAAADADGDVAEPEQAPRTIAKVASSPANG
jgi:hypothetical protein